MVLPGSRGQHLLTLFVIFYKSNTEGTNFQIMFVYMFYIDVCFKHLFRCAFNCFVIAVTVVLICFATS